MDLSRLSPIYNVSSGSKRSELPATNVSAVKKPKAVRLIEQPLAL